MLLSTLFSLSADLSLIDVRAEDERLTLVLRSSQKKLRKEWAQGQGC